MKCSNCDTVDSHERSLEGIELSTGAHSAFAYICSKCQENVLTMKIVLTRRFKDDAFKFEGYLPVASQR
jgi:hypothetical protein